MKRPPPSPPTRREVFRALAASAAAAAVTVCWTRDRGPEASAARVRPGATVTLRCAGADAYLLHFPGQEPRRVPARDGRLVFAAPVAWRAADWTPLTVTPIEKGRPREATVAIHVFTRFPRFGA